MLLLSKVKNDVSYVTISQAWVAVETHWENGLVLCGGLECPMCYTQRARTKWYGGVWARGVQDGPRMVELSDESFGRLCDKECDIYGSLWRARRRTKREPWRVACDGCLIPADVPYCVTQGGMETAVARLLGIPDVPASHTWRAWLWTVARRTHGTAREFHDARLYQEQQSGGRDLPGQLNLFDYYRDNPIKSA